MRRLLLLLLPLCVLASCAEVQTYGAAALEQRRTMNDLQARAIMAASCDISLGAYFRELSPIERRYVGLACGGAYPDAGPSPDLAPWTGSEP